MRVTQLLAALASGTLLATTALVATALPAAAVDEGPVLDGGIYWFNAPGPLADQTASTQITTGSGTTRPWVTLTSEKLCPANTANLASFVRIPQAGVPENDWNQVPMGEPADNKDADGRFYSVGAIQADRMGKPEIVAYNLENGGSGTFPFLSVCKTAEGVSLGNFRTEITVTGTTSTTLSWSIVSPAFSGGGTEAVATTTTLTATPSGADLVLTAAVSPAAASGEVTFAEGATSLGSATVAGGSATVTVSAPTAGSHTYTASFTPADAAAYRASQGTATVDLTLDPNSGQLVLTVPAAPQGPAGALTLSVPFGTPVALAGSRAADNSRVTASGAFPAVTVTDTRRDDLLTAWEVNAQATDFTGPGGPLGAKYLGWTPAVPTMTPEAGSPLMAQAGAAVPSYLDNNTSTGLSAGARLGSAATPGRGVTTLGAQLNLAIPGTTAEGAYTSTVTVTLVGG